MKFVIDGADEGLTANANLVHHDQGARCARPLLKNPSPVQTVSAQSGTNQSSTTCGELDVAPSRQQRHRAGKRNSVASDPALNTAVNARVRPAKAMCSEWRTE